MYKRIFQVTYYQVNLRLVSERVGSSNMQPWTMVVKSGEWQDHPYMLREVVNLVVDVDFSALARGPVATLMAIKMLGYDSPRLARIYVQIRCDVYMYARTAGYTMNFLCFSLEAFAETTGLEVEVAGAGRWGSPFSFVAGRRSHP